MQIELTRDSVCAGDDGDAPHNKRLTVTDGASVEDFLTLVAHSGYLPSISGGDATWSAASRVLLAVIAQQWAEPKPLFFIPIARGKLDIRNGVLHLHFNYHAQQSPDVVYDVLRRVQLSAP